MASKLPTTKTDFKQLLTDKTGKKIESPFAKYNSIGQLTCIICNQVIKSELMWNAHLNSKTHLDNKNNLKFKLTNEAQTQQQQQAKKTEITKTKTITEETTTTFKRSISTVSTTKDTNDYKDDEEVKTIGKKQKLENLINKIETVDLNNLTSNNNEINNKIEIKSKNEQLVEQVILNQQESINTSLDQTSASVLPEGFFDDPELDAKVRGTTRAELLDAEYEEFKKVIQTEEVKSDVIIEKDDVIRDVERDLEEVEELINRWTKIENLHQKREELIASSRLKKEEKIVNKNEAINDEKDDDSDVDLDNVLNLVMRSKNRC